MGIATSSFSGTISCTVCILGTDSTKCQATAARGRHVEWRRAGGTSQTTQARPQSRFLRRPTAAQDSRRWRCRAAIAFRPAALVDPFVHWCNHGHQHSAIRFVTPAERQTGREKAFLAQRQVVSERARRKQPERCSGATRDWTPVTTVRLNPKRDDVLDQERRTAQ